MEILNLKKVYFVGIKGVGVCALAKILKDLGIEVVGSDTEEKFFTDEVLKKENIKYYEGFKEENIKKEFPFDVLISSVAYLLPSSNNPEVEYAKKLNLPIYSYPEALAKIFNESFGIAICGSHGKSSTTAVLGKILKDLNLEPTVLVGSEVIEWKSNSLVGKNFLKKIKFMKENLEKLKDLKWIKKNLNKLPLFVIEADEYRSAFLNYFPRIIILTNIDFDHPDYFKNEKEYLETYLKFIKNLQEPKILITHHDFPLQKDIIHIKAKKIKKKLPFSIPGKHFQKNLHLLNAFRKIFSLPYPLFLKSLKNYKGIKRRFEIIKRTKNFIFIDDYAHHPTEVLSFYTSLKEKFPNFKKIIVFQPHTFTRTHFLFDEFLKAFRKIKKDKTVELIIFQTFPSAREKDFIEKIKNLKTERDLAKKLNLNYFENMEKLLSYLKSKITFEKKLLIASVGAGDIYKIFENLF